MSDYVPEHYDDVTLENVADGYGRLREQWARTLARKALELSKARTSLTDKLRRAHEKTAEFGHVKQRLACRISTLEQKCEEKEEQIEELQRQVAALSGSTKRHIEVRLDTGIVYVRHGTSHDDGVVTWGLWEAQQ